MTSRGWRPGGLVPRRATGDQLAQAGSLLLFGLVGWLLFSTRWGSYVGVPHTQIFLTDLVLAVVAILVVPAAMRTRHRHGAALRSIPGAAAVVLLSWAVVRLGIGGEISAVSLRDFAPYLYVGVVGLAAVGHLRVARRWITTVLVAHVAWVVWALRGYTSGVALGPTSVFALRNDVDAGVCGVAVAWSLLQISRSRSALHSGLYLVMAVFSGYALMSLQTRAGVIATAVCLVALGVRWGGQLLRATLSRRQVLALVAAGLAAAAVLIAAAAFTATGQKLVNTVTGNGDARGTVSARASAYEAVSSFIYEEPTRLAFGVGFGPDFMHITGADALYEGTEYTGVRAPHNFALNTAARLGVIGLLCELALIAVTTVTALRLLASMQRPGAVVEVAAMVAVILPVLALFGVVLESPFGAVPYFWAVGVLLGHVALRRNERAAKPGKQMHLPTRLRPEVG